MPTQARKNFRKMVHPYVFVLKEGQMGENLLDYSLMILHVTSTETIKSPQQPMLRPNVLLNTHFVAQKSFI